MIVDTATATLETFHPDLAAYLKKHGFQLRRDGEILWSIVKEIDGKHEVVTLANDPDCRLYQRRLGWLDRAARWDENDDEEGGF